MSEALRLSLERRLAGMHRLWRMAVSDMTLVQINHRERAGVLPIAFSLFHYVSGEDRTISTLLLAEQPLWERQRWAERTEMRPPDAPSRGIAMAVAERISLGNLDAWRDYQTVIFDRTEAALAGLPAGRLDEELFGGEVPEFLEGAFITMVVPAPGPIRLVDALECFVYQHGLRHMGELEHARALVGLRGMT